MTWLFSAGGASISFTDRIDGVGLMAYPEVQLGAEQDIFSNPRTDGIKVGHGYMAGQTISMQVEVRADHRPLDAVWADLLAVWRSDDVRRINGGLASLTAPSGRGVFGRALPAQPDYSRRLFGVIRAELAFQAVDDLWYGPAALTEVSFVPPQGGGLRFPAQAPFIFRGGPTVRNGAVHVDGDLPAWPVFEIAGPVTNPTVEVPGVGTLIFKTSLAYDQTLVVDTRPWSRSIKRDGAPVPGVLSAAGARLSDMALTPGAHVVLLKGQDATGTAKLRVHVAPSYSSF